MSANAILVRVLRDLAKLMEEEAAQNSAFSEKLEQLLSNLPRKQTSKTTVRQRAPEPEDIPDLYHEWEARGEDGFRHWLGELSIEVLRALVRKHDFDPSKNALRWRKIERLADLIHERFRARITRGQGFMQNH